jgi:hypothetical protein
MVEAGVASIRQACAEGPGQWTLPHASSSYAVERQVLEPYRPHPLHRPHPPPGRDSISPRKRGSIRRPHTKGAADEFVPGYRRQHSLDSPGAAVRLPRDCCSLRSSGCDDKQQHLMQELWASSEQCSVRFLPAFPTPDERNFHGVFALSSQHFYHRRCSSLAKRRAAK